MSLVKSHKQNRKPRLKYNHADYMCTCTKKKARRAGTAINTTVSLEEQCKYIATVSICSDIKLTYVLHWA